MDGRGVAGLNSRGLGEGAEWRSRARAVGVREGDRGNRMEPPVERVREVERRYCGTRDGEESTGDGRGHGANRPGRRRTEEQKRG